MTLSVAAVRYDKASVAGRKALTALANGYFGVLSGLQGDMDHFANILGLPRWCTVSSCCALCRCDGGYGPTSFRNCKPDAEWIAGIWRTREWLAWPGESFKKKCAVVVCQAQRKP